MISSSWWFSELAVPDIGKSEFLNVCVRSADGAMIGVPRQREKMSGCSFAALAPGASLDLSYP
jgi:hypothetical protein